LLKKIDKSTKSRTKQISLATKGAQEKRIDKLNQWQINLKENQTDKIREMREIVMNKQA
jgi:hypothetical protein